MTWYRYETGPWWRYTRGMTDAEKGQFADALNAALEDRRTGVNPIADEILRESESFSAKRRAAAKARWGEGRKPDDALASKCMQVHASAYMCNARKVRAMPNIHTDRHTEHTVQPVPSVRRAPARETDAPPADGRTDRDLPGMENPETPARPPERPVAPPSAPPGPTPIPPSVRPAEALRGARAHPPPDPALAAALPPTATAADRERRWGELAATLEDHYALLAAIPDPDLPAFAVWACYESGNDRAVARYRRFCRMRGPDAFRRELETFLGECHTGGEPDSRGRAFMARIKRAEEDA